MRFSFLVAAVLGITLAGCGGGSASSGGNAAWSESAEADGAKVTLTASMDRREASIAEPVEVRVEVVADEDVVVSMPGWKDLGDDVVLHDLQQPAVRTLEDGRQAYTQVATIESYAPGEHALPAVEVRYVATAGGDAGESEQGASTTDGSGEASDDGGSDASGEQPAYASLKVALPTLNVTSVLADDAEADLRDVRDPEVLAVPLGWWWWVIVGAAAGLLVGGWLAVRRMLRTRAEYVPPPIPAHEWAFEQLRLLDAENLPARGEAKAYYYRISEIVRGYIERRFGLMAPERTTEEFLEELRTGGGLPVDVQPMLVEFLQACDVVKYARYEPSAEEIAQTGSAAREFIMKTRFVVAGDIAQGEGGDAGGQEVAA